MSKKEEITKESAHSKDISESYENEVKNEKKFLNCYFCKMSTGIIAAYIHVILSIAMNIVNRIIFLHYEFEFDYTLILLQQLVCIIFYIILSWKSKLFKEKAGELSFRDFWKLKFKYVGYSIFFLI